LEASSSRTVSEFLVTLQKVECGSRQKRKALSTLGLTYDNAGNDFLAHRRRELLQHLLAATFDVLAIGRYFLQISMYHHLNMTLYQHSTLVQVY
jgi:hypothetical protein